MAFEGQQPVKLSIKAAGDLSAKQYFFVKLDASGDVVVCDGITDIPIGVLQNAPLQNASAEVCVLGVTKVSADAALNEFDLIGTSADGQADAKTVGSDITEYVVGQMITATTAAAELGTASINCMNPHRAA